MPVVDLWIPGEVRAARPRVAGSGRGMFTSPAVREWRNGVAFEARRAMAGRPPVAVLVSLSIEVYGSPSDLDNIAKVTQDALNGIVFRDDRLIARLTVSDPDRQLGKGGGIKRKAARYGVRVVVESL